MKRPTKSILPGRLSENPPGSVLSNQDGANVEPAFLKIQTLKSSCYRLTSSLSFWKLLYLKGQELG